MTYGLIGEHLPHSFSKEIHRRCADYEYRLLELSSDEVAPFMERADFLAINVTIPYKQVVMPYLDTIHEAAAAIGAVNTVVKRDGKLYGYNTDFFGLRALVHRTGVSLAGRKVLILGTGGTAHTARAVAAAEGAREILTATRHPEGDYISYDDIYRLHTDAEVMGLDTRLGSGDAGANLEHMCAERAFAAVGEMIGVILHKGRLSPFTHSLHNSGHCRNLPVALAAVTVAA